MSAKRKAIRHAAVAALMSKVTDVGVKVYPSRARPLMFDNLPAISVYTRGETVDALNEAPLEYDRRARLVVEIMAKADENLDDYLDDAAQQVETIFAINHMLDGTCDDVRLKQVDSEFVDSGQNLVGSLMLTYEARYTSLSPEDQSGSLNNFDTADVKYDLAPPDGRAEAEDMISLSQ